MIVVQSLNGKLWLSLRGLSIVHMHVVTSNPILNTVP